MEGLTLENGETMMELPRADVLEELEDNSIEYKAMQPKDDKRFVMGL